MRRGYRVQHDGASPKEQHRTPPAQRLTVRFNRVQPLRHSDRVMGSSAAATARRRPALHRALATPAHARSAGPHHQAVVGLECDVAGEELPHGRCNGSAKSVGRSVGPSDFDLEEVRCGHESRPAVQGAPLLVHGATAHGAAAISAPSALRIASTTRSAPMRSRNRPKFGGMDVHVHPAAGTPISRKRLGRSPGCSAEDTCPPREPGGSRNGRPFTKS